MKDSQSTIKMIPKALDKQLTSESLIWDAITQLQGQLNLLRQQMNEELNTLKTQIGGESENINDQPLAQYLSNNRKEIHQLSMIGYHSPKDDCSAHDPIMTSISHRTSGGTRIGMKERNQNS